MYILNKLSGLSVMFQARKQLGCAASFY